MIRAIKDERKSKGRGQDDRFVIHAIKDERKNKTKGNRHDPAYR